MTVGVITQYYPELKAAPTVLNERIEQKFLSNQSTSAQPPIFLPLFVSHQWIKMFLEPPSLKVTFWATNKSIPRSSHPILNTGRRCKSGGFSPGGWAVQSLCSWLRIWHHLHPTRVSSCCGFQQAGAFSGFEPRSSHHCQTQTVTLACVSALVSRASCRR